MNPTPAKIDTVYRSTIGFQPYCAGTDATGELVWDKKIKEPWHLKMFPVHYGGDFRDQWMWLLMYEQGLDWTGAMDQLEVA